MKVILVGFSMHHQPVRIFYEGSESKHICWDPKDGELYLNGLKPKETLVEEPRSVNVQITCHI